LKTFQRIEYVFTSNDHCDVHQFFIVTSLPVIQTIFFQYRDFQSAEKKCLLFRPKPHKLPVIWYIYCYFHDFKSAKKNIRTKTNRGKTFINIWITKIQFIYYGGVLMIYFEEKKLGRRFKKFGGRCLTCIRIWTMSGPFSRFLVIFYPLSPRAPLFKCFPTHFHFCDLPEVKQYGRS
jgi:hypothetical protein